MKYHLQKFDNIVNNNGGEVTAVGEIIDEIKQSAFRIVAEEEIKVFIQNHQEMLLAFKEYEPIRKQADEVLDFLEVRFSKFVDEDQPISEAGWNRFWHTYGQTITDKREGFKGSISTKLYNIILPIIEPEGLESPTIYRVKYLKSFWKNWPTSDSFKLLNEEKLIAYLISENYNTPSLLRYITSGIIRILEQEHDPMTLKQMLRDYANKLKSILTKIGTGFDRNFPALKPLLDQWLEQESKQCDKKLKNYNPNQLELIPKETHKLETSMSVAQTAYFFKLLNQAEVITNKVHMEILQTISKSFRSKKSDRIGLESLRSKYYNVEDSTKESVREILKEVLRLID